MSKHAAMKAACLFEARRKLVWILEQTKLFCSWLVPKNAEEFGNARMRARRLKGSPTRMIAEQSQNCGAKKSGLHRCKPLFVLVLMGGIEPSTY